MEGKTLAFVTGHSRPAVAPTGARYVRRHPDGTPMLATSTRDTLADCEARYAAAQRKATKTKKEAPEDGPLD